MDILKKELTAMDKSRSQTLSLAQKYLLGASDENVIKVRDFLVALENDRIVRSQTEDGWLTYIFVENKND